jgi:hypothetical protein
MAYTFGDGIHLSNQKRCSVNAGLGLTGAHHAIVMTTSKKLLDGLRCSLHNLVSLLLTNKTIRGAAPGRRLYGARRDRFFNK